MAVTLNEQLNLLTRTAWVESNDNLMRQQSQLSRLLIQRARRDKKTGGKVEFGLRTARPPVKRLSHPLDTYAQAGAQTHTRCSLEWSQYETTLQITGFEMRSQHGINIQQLLKRPNLQEMPVDEREVLMDVLSGQITGGQEALAEYLGTDIYESRGAVGGVVGLPAIIDDHTSSYAGLAYNDSVFETDDVSSLTYWQPYVDSNSGTKRDVSLERIGKGINRVRRGGEMPESVVAAMNWDMYTEIEVQVEGSKDYRDSKLASLGYTAIEWRHCSFMPDDRCPANCIYLLNLNHLYLQIRPSADIDNWTGWKEAANQDAAAGAFLLECQLVCNDRHRQGKIDDLNSVAD